MEIRRYKHASEFYERAEPFLLRDEASNNLIFGLCSALIGFPERIKEQPYLAVIEEIGEVVGAAVRIPPNNLVLAQMPAEALGAIIVDVQSLYGASLVGVLGPKHLSLAFAEAWGQVHRLDREQRIYRLERIIPPAPISGRARPATESDQALLAAWSTAFQVEALGETPDPADVDRMVNGFLHSGEWRGILLWEDPEPVSMAGFTGKTPSGIRVSLVYTPPEHRKNGYASACVAALSQQLLDRGRKFCFLFTDLANPTSNHVYQAIGYEPVCDVDVYKFDGLEKALEE